MTFAKLNAITKSSVLSGPQGRPGGGSNPDACLDRRRPASSVNSACRPRREAAHLSLIALIHFLLLTFLFSICRPIGDITKGI